MKTFDLEGAADFLRVSKDSMRDMANSGKVPAAKIGPTTGYRWVFTDEALEEYLREEIRQQTTRRRKAFPYAASVTAIPESSRKRRRPAPPPPLNGEKTCL